MTTPQVSTRSSSTTPTATTTASAKKVADPASKKKSAPAAAPAKPKKIKNVIVAAPAAAQEEKKDGAAGEAKKKKRRKHPVRSYRTGLRAILTAVHPDLDMKKSTLHTLNEIFEEEAKEYSLQGFSILGKTRTLSIRDLQSAVSRMRHSQGLKEMFAAGLEAVRKVGLDAAGRERKKLLKDKQKAADAAAVVAAAGKGDATATAEKKKKAKSDFRQQKESDLFLSICRSNQLMRNEQRKNFRISTEMPVFITGCLDWLARRLLKFAGNMTIAAKLKQVRDEDVQNAIYEDAVLSEFLPHVRIHRTVSKYAYVDTKVAAALSKRSAPKSKAGSATKTKSSSSVVKAKAASGSKKRKRATDVVAAAAAAVPVVASS